jgi:hypothetical protein
VALEDARIGRLDLLANAVLSLFRVSADALDEGDALAAALSSSVIALAEVLGTLAQAPQPWPPDVCSQVAARVNSTIAAVGSRSASRAPLIASIIRATGRDVLAVLPSPAR